MKMEKINKHVGFMRKFVLIFLVLQNLGSLKAQTVKTLSLEEAVVLALANDRQLKVDSAQLNIVNAKLAQAKQQNLPDIGLNANYTRISNNITPFTVAFPTGDVTLNPQILNQSFNSLQLKQLIWGGGKVNYGIKISEKESQIAKFDLEKNSVNTAYNISALWYNLYVLKKAKQIIDANIATLFRTQTDINNFVKEGIVLKNDALKIDLAITNLQSNLTDVTSSIAALNFNLCSFTGLPLNTKLELPELAEVDENDLINLDNFLQVAVNNRVELKTIQAYRDIAGVGYKISKSNYYPTISAIASGNYNLPEQRLFPNQNVFTPTWFAGVNVNWAVSSIFKNPAKTNESKQQLTKAEAMYSQAEQGILLEVNAAYTEYVQAKQKINLAQKAVAQADENFRVEQNRLKQSVITTTDFLDANNKLLQAKLNLSAAYANAKLALRKLNKTIGK